MKKIIIIIFILLLTGCYNYRELNNLDIISSIGIDYKKNMYEVSVQVLNGKQSKDSEDSQIIVYSAKGKTINDALRNIYSKTSKELYRGHVSNLILSDKVAKNSIVNVLDLFERYTDIRDEMNIMVVKNVDAKKVLTVLTTEKIVPSEYIKLAINNKHLKTGATSSTRLDEFSSNYLKKYIDPVITVISVDNYNKKAKNQSNITSSNPKTKIIINNIAITKKGKLVDYLNKKETIGYNFITNNIKNIMIPIKCDKNNYSSISIIKSNTKKNITKNNNTFLITLNINLKGNITEYNCNNINEKVIKKLENKTKIKVNNYINNALFKQEIVDSEFLGLKRMIYLINNNYNNENYKVIIKTKVNINRKGEIKTSLKDKK